MGSSIAKHIHDVEATTSAEVHQKEKKLNPFHNRKRTTTSFYIIFLVYGMALTLPGVVGIVLSSYFNPTAPGVSDNAIFYQVAYASALQVFGTIFGNFTAARLKKFWNIKWIMVAGFGLATICYVFISLITTFWPPLVVASNSARVFYLNPFIFYSFLLFVLGFSLGPVGVVSYGYIFANFDSRGKDVILSTINGVFGLGAAIIPLSSFGLIRLVAGAGEGQSFLGFYVAAGVLAFISFMASFLINYRHYFPSKKESHLLRTKDNYPSIKGKGILITMVAVLLLYNFGEKVFFFNFNNFIGAAFQKISEAFNFNTYFSGGNSPVAIPNLLIATFIGVFFLVMGFYRLICSFTVLKWLGPKKFLFLSFSILLLSFFILFIPYVVTTIAGVVVVVILFGLGIGNMYPTIQAYAATINREKKQLYAEVLTAGGYVSSMSMIIIAAGFGQQLTETVDATPANPNLLAVAYAPWIISCLLVFTGFITFILGSTYVKKQRLALGAETADEKKLAFILT